MNELDFSGKRALVAGGSRGIGRAISLALAARGAEVVVNYRADDESATATVEAIRQAGGRATSVRANLVSPEQIDTMIAAVGDGGPLDILVYSAALGSFKPATELRANQWDLTLNVNARGFLLAAIQAAALMTPGASIVALSSLGSVRAIPNYGAIGISKAALEAEVRYLAAEFGPRGIRVNGLSAGLVEGTSISLHPEHEQLMARSIANTPLGRIARTDDVADVVLFLCSPLARWITGQVIVADGGMSIGFGS